MGSTPPEKKATPPEKKTPFLRSAKPQDPNSSQKQASESEPQKAEKDAVESKGDSLKLKIKTTQETVNKNQVAKPTTKASPKATSSSVGGSVEPSKKNRNLMLVGA